MRILRLEVAGEFKLKRWTVGTSSCSWTMLEAPHRLPEWHSCTKKEPSSNGKAIAPTDQTLSGLFCPGCEACCACADRECWNLGSWK